MTKQKSKTKNTPAKSVRPERSTGNYIRERIREYIDERAKIEARRGSYRASNNPRSRVNTVFGGSGDQHADAWTRKLTRELSRDLDRNADVFHVMHNAWARAMVGAGVRVRPTTSDSEFNRLIGRVIHRRFSATKGGIDARQMHNWYQLQSRFVRSVGIDGDAGILKLSDGRIQILEAEQITGGPTGINGTSGVEGIEFNEAGAPTKFYVCGYSPLGGINTGSVQGHDPDNVEFAALCDRASQTRGMPLLVGALDDFERIDSYRESEIIAAEGGSSVYGALEHPSGDMGDGGMGGFPGSDNAIRGGMTSNGTIDWQPTAHGAILDLPNGKKYVPIDPNRPNPNCAPFLLEIIRQFTANADLPYEWSYNDLRGLSWSINRALIQQARDSIKVRQIQSFATTFSSIYIWQLKWCLENEPELEGISLPDDWESHEHQWPEISWPDEGKEYEAQANGLARALTTPQRLFGADWQAMMEERAEALTFAAELAKKHNEQFKNESKFHVDPFFFLGIAPTEVGWQKNEGGPISEAQRQQRSDAAKRAAEERHD